MLAARLIAAALLFAPAAAAAQEEPLVLTPPSSEPGPLEPQQPEAVPETVPMPPPAAPSNPGQPLDAPGEIDGVVQNEKCHDQFFEGGSMELAIHHCTQALQSGDLSEGDIVTALVNRGIAYKQQGQYELAIADYTNAIERQPEAGDLYTTRANAYLEMAQLDAAITDANKAIAYNPDYADAYYVRGRVFEALGQKSFAKNDFLRAYELAPGNADIESKAFAYGANQN